MKRRICIFCESWESGGIEAFLTNALARMDRGELELDLVVSDLRESVFTQKLVDMGVRIVELSGSLRNLKENYRRFRQLLDARRYDVLHLNIYQGMSLYYAELARRAGVPVRIAHSHNTALRKSALRPAKLLLHDAYRRRCTGSATELWACSKQAAAFLFSPRELSRRGFRFVPNGIDTERFRFRQDVRDEVRRALGLDGRLVVGNVGRLCYQKNQTFLLDVMAELRKHRPESVLLLVGVGEDRAALTEKAKRLQMEDSVLFYGKSERVEQLLWAMDVFAFPSRFEGLGIAAVEAQCAGLPAVCSESVPEEALISEAAHRLPLAQGAAAWGGALLRYGTAPHDGTAADAIRSAGFDIANAAQLLSEKYGKG